MLSGVVSTQKKCVQVNWSSSFKHLQILVPGSQRFVLVTLALVHLDNSGAHIDVIGNSCILAFCGHHHGRFNGVCFVILFFRWVRPNILVGSVSGGTRLITCTLYCYTVR
jgi:hypothetical protein